MRALRLGAPASVWALTLALSGCGLLDDVSTGDDDDDEPKGPSLSYVTASGETDAEGTLAVTFEVPQGTASFQISARTEAHLFFEDLTAPDGTRVLDWSEWLSTPYSMTMAFYGSEEVIALDWPIRDVDGPLEAGTWTVGVSVADLRTSQYLIGSPVDLTVALKKDRDLSSGRIGVQIVWADGVDGDPAVVSAIEAGVERWREIWAGVGLELVEHYESSRIDPDLPFAFDSDPSVEKLAGRKAEGDLQLIVGETIQNDLQLFGVSAGIPGTIEASPRTFVVLSWLTHAGVDGVFDEAEIRLMGETMAHEVGHYTGLFHPVEQPEFAQWDALDDTPDCRNAQGCQRDLGQNLMFPYPICNAQGCSPQGEISAQQAAVVQRFVGAL